MAHALSSCRHTAKLLGLSVTEGRLALVMRRYPATLTDEMRRRAGSPMSLPHSLQFAQGLLRGLSTLHAHGVVVGNLCPGNVLLDSSEGEAPEPVVWLDVGRAKTASPHVSIRYMAPEQVAGAGGAAPHATSASDMWAFATNMVNVLTGKQPWGSTTPPGQISAQIANGHAPELPGGLPFTLHELLRRCLCREPAKRPSAAEALRLVRWELERRVLAAPEPVLPVRVHVLYKTGTCMRQPASAELRLPLQHADGQPPPDGAVIKVYGNLKLAAVLGTSERTRVPREHARYLLHTQRGMVEVTEGQLSGDGFRVESTLTVGARDAAPVALLVVDIRLRKPRVRMTLDGPMGSVFIMKGVDIDPAMNSNQLGAAAVARLQPGKLPALADGFVREQDERFVPVVIGSLLFGEGSIALRCWGAERDMTINVKGAAGQAYSVQVSKGTLTRQLKSLVHETGGPPPEQQTLAAAGEEMEDEACVGSYRLEQGSEVVLSTRVCGI